MNHSGLYSFTMDVNELCVASQVLSQEQFVSTIDSCRPGSGGGKIKSKPPEMSKNSKWYSSGLNSTLLCMSSNHVSPEMAFLRTSTSNFPFNSLLW